MKFLLHLQSADLLERTGFFSDFRTEAPGALLGPQWGGTLIMKFLLHLHIFTLKHGMSLTISVWNQPDFYGRSSVFVKPTDNQLIFFRV